MTVTQTGANVVGQKVSDGIDTVRNVEALKFSDQTLLVQVPGAPTIGTASATAGAFATGSATVSWTGPTAVAGAPAISSFAIVATPTTGTAPVVTRTGIARTALSGTVTGLVNGTTYTLQVRAVNLFGNGPLSAPSNAVTPVGLATAPTAVVATRGNASVGLTWVAPSADGGSPITAYQVQVRTGATVVRTEFISGIATTAVITGLTNGTAYNFRVQAINANGSGALSLASNTVTPATLPDAPTIGTATASATATTAGSATVTWTAASNGGSALTSNEIVATPVGAGTIVTRTGIAGAALTGTVTGLANGTTYTLQVRALNILGSSPLSAASDQVTPTGVPGVTTAVVATRANASVGLSWTAPTTDGGVAISGYTVQVRTGATVVRAVALTGAGTSTVITGLSNGTAYNFRVQAVNTLGSGALSVASNIVTPATVPDAPVLGAVTSGPVTAGTNPLTVTVSWTPPALPATNGGSAITGYTVSAYNPDGTVNQRLNVGSTIRTQPFTFTVAGPFTFDVQAFNVVGTGALSARSAPTNAS